MSETPRDCKHGQLARSCELCELERENAALREQLAERDAELDSLRRSIVAAIDGKPCPTPAQWTQMQAIIRAANPKEDA